MEVINSLQVKRTYIISILDGLARAVPNGVILDQAELKEDILSISGQSESNSLVSLFMRNLEEIKIFTDPKLQEIKVNPNQSEQGVSFTVEVLVTE